MTPIRSRRARRLRFAAAMLSAAVVLPGLAFAGYADCVPGDADNDCPAMSETFEAGTQFSYPDVASGITFRFGQPDEAMPILRADYYVPKGWWFGVDQLREAPVQVSPDPHPGEPATCETVYSDGSLTKAEGLGPVAGIRANVNVDFMRSTYDWGISGGNTPSVSFLRWNAGTQTADMCMFLRNPDFDPFPMPDYDGRTGAIDFLLPFTLQKLTGDAAYDWKLHVDLAEFYRNPYLRDASVNVLMQSIGLAAKSAGNWNTDAATGDKKAIVFSKTPKDPGVYQLGAEFFTCKDGTDLASTTNTTGCKNGRFVSETKTVSLAITLPPRPGTHDFARITGPSTPSLCIQAPCAFGLLVAPDTFQVTWQQPAVGLNDTIRGYALAIAEPNNQASRHFERVVTQKYQVDAANNPVLDANGNPVPNPDFTPSTADNPVCGADGKEKSCTLTLRFPLSNLAGGITNEEDGKYDIALVTIYANNNRTDGKCDDATGEGVPCPPGTPVFKRVMPGISYWQVLVTAHKWLNAYVESQTFRGSPDFIGPAFMLFVDYETQEAEYVIWNPMAGKKAQFFPGASNLIKGQDGAGVVSFGNFTPLGGAQTFRYDGTTDPIGACPQIDVEDTFMNFNPNFGDASACGTFLLWDPKNIPDVYDPLRMPSYEYERFEGYPV